MSEFWESVLDRSPSPYAIEDLESATYRLVAEQVLYRCDKGSRTAYGAVERYERDVQKALEPLGLIVKVHRQAKYAYAVPVRVKAGVATMKQTLMALVLRRLYDGGAREGRFNDDLEVLCDLVELDEMYKLATGRVFPSKGELRPLMLTMKRWGLVRIIEDGADLDVPGADQPYQVAIRPGIVDILGESALMRLAQWAPQDDSIPAESETSPTEGTEASP
ncbi:MAG: DUF4194 domain-containing protein [Pseudomonadota bacterium]